jgi:general secretion pathway protein G
LQVGSHVPGWRNQVQGMVKVKPMNNKRSSPLPDRIAAPDVRQNGYTLIELLIVLAIIGLLISIALPQYRYAQRRAQESVLRENLTRMREVIDQYYSDKGKYPDALQTLVTEGYLRKMPWDPITKSDQTWQVLYEDQGTISPDPNAPNPGIWDVRSAAVGTTLEGTPYNEL